jgi:hypothetical protein
MKYYLIFLFVFLNCSHSQKKVVVKSKEMGVEANYKFKIIKFGSDDALMKLETLFTTRGTMYCELLPYAKYLADHYNSGYGCKITANALIATCLFKYRDNEPQWPEYDHLKLLNSEEKKEIFKYLEKGASLNHNGCLIFLREVYKKGFGVDIDLEKADYYNSLISY